MASSKQYDVLISGGGASGCLAALGLANNTNLTVGVIEKTPPKPSEIHPSFDARVIAVSEVSWSILDALKLDTSQIDYHPIKSIEVSDRKHIGYSQLDAQSLGHKQFGRVVSLAQLGYQAFEQLKKTSVDYLSPQSIEAVQLSEDAVTVQTQDGEIKARLLVIAEGANSPTRQLANISHIETDYGQHALVLNTKLQMPHQSRAFERFTQYGPVAFLPIYDGQDERSMSVVWSCGSAHIDSLMQFEDESFKTYLQNLFGNRLGKIESVTKRYAYPINLITANSIAEHRRICIGNAAQALHPIAGQGFNLGIRDVFSLVCSLREHKAGSFLQTNEYKMLRHKDRNATIKGIDTLVRGFSNHYVPLVLGRSVGLGVMHKSMFAQDLFTEFAMGERGELSRLIKSFGLNLAGAQSHQEADVL